MTDDRSNDRFDYLMNLTPKQVRAIGSDPAAIADALIDFGQDVFKISATVARRKELIEEIRRFCFTDK